MAKRDGFTVYGDAAGELIRAQAGKPAKTDDERALRIAALVHMHMGRGADQGLAIALIKAVARDGLEAAAMVCTARTGPSKDVPLRGRVR